MKKIVIAGGPHTGKTTLIEALKAGHPQWHFVPEPATSVIESEYQKQTLQADYSGVFPWNRYLEFVPLVIQKSFELESQIPTTIPFAILDRSLIDNLAYAKLNRHHHLLPQIQRHIDQADYHLALLCEFVGVYVQTDVRKETESEAQVIHQHLCQAYTDSGVKILSVPAITVEDRVKLIESYLDANIYSIKP